MTPNNPSVEDYTILIHDACFLLRSARNSSDETDRSAWQQGCDEWLSRFENYFDAESRSRVWLKQRVVNSLNAVLEGSADIAEISDDLIEHIDDYADALPLIRSPKRTFASIDGVEKLARRIYEISGDVEAEAGIDWETEDDRVKAILRETAARLLAEGLAVAEPNAVEIRSDWRYVDPTLTVADLQEIITQIGSRVSELSEWETNHLRVLIARYHHLLITAGVPPNIPMPPGFQPDLMPKHIHDDDGTVEGCPGCFSDPPKTEPAHD